MRKVFWSLGILPIFAILLGVPYGLRAESSYTLALRAFHGEQWNEAAVLIEKEIKLNGNSAQAWELKGKILLKKNQFAEAEQALRKALEIDPELKTVYFYLGDALFYQRSWEAALSSYSHYNQKLPDPRDALVKMIYCEIAAGDLSEATRFLTYLDPFDKDHPGYYFARAALDRAMGNMKKVDASLKQVQTLFGNITFNRYFPDYMWIFKSATPNISTAPSGK